MKKKLARTKRIKEMLRLHLAHEAHKELARQYAVNYVRNLRQLGKALINSRSAV